MPEDDVEAVLDCFRCGLADDGPADQAFEEALGELVGAEHVVAVSSGTAALQLALLAAGVEPGDEVIVPAMTFVAAAARGPRAAGRRLSSADSTGDADLNLDPARRHREVTARDQG